MRVTHPIDVFSSCNFSHGCQKGKQFDTKLQQQNHLNLCGPGYAGNPKGKACFHGKVKPVHDRVGHSSWPASRRSTAEVNT